LSSQNRRAQQMGNRRGGTSNSKIADSFKLVEVFPSSEHACYFPLIYES